MKKISILFLVLLATARVCQAVVTDPGWFQAEPEEMQPNALAVPSGDQASNSFAAAFVPTSPIAEVITPQIQALADSLQHDPLKIFHYVHDNIRFVLYFGSKKGAQLTLLEKSGNDFDQCALLSALLRASGFSPQYQFGWQIIPYDDDLFEYDLHHWWQLTLNNTSWTNTVEYVNRLANLRGYPKIYYVNENTNTFTPASFLIQRLWVNVTVGADNYNLDPAFKISEQVSGISLTNAMSGTSISNALKTAAGGTDTGSSTSGLSETNVRGKLTEFTTNLLNHIQSNAPNASVQEIIGGWNILPAYDGFEYSSFNLFQPVDPNGHMGILTWTYQPTNLMSTLAVSFNGTNYQWLMPQLQGQRLALTFDANSSAQLWLDDSNIITKTVGIGNGATNVTLKVTHPKGGWDLTNNVFIPNLTNSNNQTVTNTYQTTNATYALMYAFEPDQGWLQQRQNKLNDYLQQGFTNGSRQVVCETLNVMGLNWMLQTKQTEDLLAAQLDVLPQYFHRLGRMAQETGKGYYVDVYMQITGEYPSGGYDAAHLAIRSKYFDLATLFGSALEHGLIEQLQNTNLVGASTVKMLQIANAANQTIYLASSTNWTSGANIRSLLSYTGAIKNQITTNFINRGYYVLLPENGSNHVSAEVGSWAGYGLVARRMTNGLADSQMIISGGYHGGFASDSTAGVNYYYNLFVAQNQANAFTSVPLLTPALTGADPVDLANGTFQVDNQDLSLGQAAPRGINLTRHYNGTRRASNPAGMANGWLHSYYINAATIAAPQAGVGETTPAQAAPMLAATAAAIATYNAGYPNAKNWMVTLLISKWGVDQLIKNGVSVNLGKDTVQFIQQPDGSFTPPANCTMTLTKTNSAYTLLMRHGNRFNFDGAGLLTNIMDQYNQSLNLTYNASNWVSTIKDWKNRQFTFNYSGTPSRLTSVTDGTRTVSYGYSTAYNSQGDLVSFTDAESKTTTYGYDTNHQITATIDAESRLVVSNRYDGQGHVTKQFTQGDTNKTWIINWAGTETTTLDPAGGVTDYFYDEKGRLQSVYDPLNHSVINYYDGQNRITATTLYPSGETKYFYYDSNHNLVRSKDQLGFTNQFFFDSQNNLTRSVDQRGNPSTFGYNAQFSLTGSTNGAGDFVNYSYNSDGTLHSRTDAGGTTTYGYDSYGQLNSVTYPGSLGGESFVNSAFGDVTSHTDGRGFITSFSYNSRRELTNSVAPTNLVTKVVYDAVGNVASTTDARGFTTSNTWSATRHLLKTTLPTTPQGAPTVTNAYDSRDWVTRTVDALQNPTLFTNDLAGRLISRTDPVLRTTRFNYDANGRNIATINAANKTNSQTWDKRGGLIKSTDGAGRFSSRAYDATGNQITLTNRKTKIWRFQFDGANRLTNTITPLGRSSSVAFNNRGLVSTAKDPANQTTSLFYDAKGRLTNRTDNVGSTFYGLDANDNRTSVVESGKTNSWTFDAYNRVTTYRDTSGNLIQYRYDASGNVTNLIYPGNRTVSYAYDSLNRLTNVTDWAGRKSSVGYDLNSRITSIVRPNGSYSTIGYDAAGQATNILELMGNTLPIAIFRLNWTNTGSMAWEFAAPLPHAATVPTRTMEYDDDNRLTKVNTISVGSDANGNLTNAPLTNSTFANYVYDGRNRLTSSGGVTNAYDALNNRVGISSGTNTTTLVVNPNAALPQVLMRIKNGVTNYYIYGVGLLYEITETATATNTRTYHFDFRGSTVALSADSGFVTDRIEYSAYGLTTYRTGTTDTPFLFNGRYGVQTDNNGLLYMRARYYNPYLCRFLNADPSGFAGGLNHYAYANGNPVSLIDPFGLGAVGDNGGTSWLSLMGNGLNNTVTAMGHTLGFYLNPPGWTSENWDQLGDQFYSMATPENPAATPYVVGLLGVSASGATLAGGVGLWGAAGLPTMNIAIGTGAPFHVAYGSGEAWVHASTIGGRGLGSLLVTEKGAEAYVAAYAWGQITGIPVLSSSAVLTTGGTAATCVGAAGTGFVRGWLPFLAF